MPVHLSQTQRFGAFLLSAVALALVVAVFGSRLLTAAAGPEVEIITHLKRLEVSGLELSLDGGTLRGNQVSFQRIGVSVDADGTAAEVICTLDFTGQFERPGESFRTSVSSVGLEAIAYRLEEGEWRPLGSQAPRLAAAVAALEARRTWLERGAFPPDAGSYGLRLLELRRRSFRSEAWYIRGEREQVDVTEDFRLLGDLPDRPVDERGSRRLTLIDSDAADAGAVALGFTGDII